jgi:hypothetical protein
MGDGNHFVPRANSRGPEGQFDRVGAGRDANRMRNAMIRREFGFKGFNFRAQNIPAA